MLKSFFPKDIAQARRSANFIGYPVVLKLCDPNFMHKTDFGGVKLDISNNKHLEKAYLELESLANKFKLLSYQFQLQPMLKGYLEVIIGVKRDEDSYVRVGKDNVLRKKGFGHTVVFGGGGIYTEIYKDVSLRVVPLTEDDAIEMLEETNIYKVLKGARGKRYRVDKIVDVILKLNNIILDYPQIRELDINPLFVGENEVFVADLKIII